MFAKLLITGKLETITGLHIGTGGTYSAIGTADSMVIRDAMTNLPIIPGSSLKGKLRSVLAEKKNPEKNNYDPKRNSHENDCDEIKALFGSQSNKGCLIFQDLFINEACINKLMDIGINVTEVKFENTINRITSVANPRQIERVIRGCVFDLNIVCNVTDENKTETLFGLLTEGMKLLELDYLGGNGSRGYGKIAFRELKAECAAGNISDDLIDKCNKMLEGVERV